MVICAQEEAPLLRNVLKMTMGIMLLGTPHGRAGLARWAEIMCQYMYEFEQTISSIPYSWESWDHVHDFPLHLVQSEFSRMMETWQYSRLGFEFGQFELAIFYESLPLLDDVFVSYLTLSLQL